MIHANRLTCCTLVLLFILLVPMTADAQEVVLLRNGQVFRGAVFDEGVRLLVQLEGSGQIVLPREQVAVRCGSLSEACEFKRSLLHQNDFTGHLDLAEWALRQRLFAEAAEALLTAQQRDANHPRVAELRRRLLQAAQPAPEVADRSTPESWHSRAEEAVSSLSREAVQTYTDSVQPLLWNSCLVGGCHTAGSGNKLELLKTTGGRSATHRLTQRNLMNLLPYIEGEAIDDVQLLKMARTVHGGGSALLDNERLGHYQLLRRWVETARRPAGSRIAEAAPPTIQPPEPPLLQPDNTHRLPPRESESARDPFDPEVFNRRFFPERYAEPVERP